MNADLESMPAAEFVEACYRRLLGRDADAPGRDALLAELASGLSRADVIRRMVEGEEFMQRQVAELPQPLADSWPHGHYHSPVPAMQQIRDDYDRIVPLAARSVPGVDMREDVQLGLLREFARFQEELPFRAEPDARLRYYGDNDYFPGSDAITLYSMLRHAPPKRVIEVGSGFSSAVMLDTDELFLGRSIEFTFIEPYPGRLRDLLRDGDADRVRILEQPVQEVPLTAFDVLAAGDYLFIDSSHVGKFGSDVTHLFGNVLPRLRPGVLVHVHDIFWPFDYPQAWLAQGRAWNEAYLLRMFLTGNRDFEVLFFVDWLRRFATEEIAKSVPNLNGYAGASIWLRRTN